MDGIVAWITANWVNVVAILWTVDQILKVVAQFNPDRDWVDNVSDLLGKILISFFPKK